jgi:hypothetical protein
VVLALLLAACSSPNPPASSSSSEDWKDKDGKDVGKMADEEMERGLALCRGYVTRLCGCAARDPSLAESCDLAKGQPQGLELHIALLHGQKGPLSPHDHRRTQAGARKIVAACVEADAKLDPVTCPRP